MNQLTAQAKIKLYLCPSDTLATETPSVGVITAMYWFYDGSSPNWYVAEPWAGYSPAFGPFSATTYWDKLGRTNYLPCSGGSGVVRACDRLSCPFAQFGRGGVRLRGVPRSDDDLVPSIGQAHGERAALRAGAAEHRNPEALSLCQRRRSY